MQIGMRRAADKPPIPAHGPAEVLFDGHGLGAFDSFLKTKGLNSDPEHVFTVEHGAIHISGKEMGYLITKQPFHDFYLRAEVKWGEGTYGERAGQARDSGILYNLQGDQKVRPRSIEVHISEGGAGDFGITVAAALQVHIRHHVSG